MLRFLPETPDDFDEVEMLLDLAFAPGRGALSSYQLRDGVDPIPELCRIARDEWNAVAGCIRYWPVLIGDAGAPALLLGPIAVHPTRQGEGIGARLMAETIADAELLGWSRILLVGDEPYYARFGFSHAVASQLDFPKPVSLPRLLGRALTPGAFCNVGGMVRAWNSDQTNQ